MGERGPAPKRSDKRLGHTSKASKAAVKTAATPAAKCPPPKRDWHPIAKDWYLSLGESGQSVFYTSSDWMTAYAVAESMSREFKPQQIGSASEGEPIMAELPPKAASLMGWLKACSLLLATEGDRRRLQLELHKAGPAEEAPDVSELAEYRRRLSG